MGKHIPKINDEIMVNTKEKNIFPPESEITSEENFNPRPVSVIMPIIITAHAHAVATGITASTPL